MSVLLSVHNGERFLREAVESILSQSYDDFELLLVDDASTDASAEILASCGDPRVRVMRNQEKLGLAASLNRGISAARGEYVARMDADDVSLPHRLARQVAFLDSHPEVGVCGSWARVIDGTGRVTGALKPPRRSAAGKACWRPSPFVHPTCLLRAALLADDQYDPRDTEGQDYGLWLRLAPKTRFYNLAEFLLLYRVHGANITSEKRDQQLRGSYRAFTEFLGTDRVGYDAFLALARVQLHMNPLRRAYFYWLASSRTGIAPVEAVRDNLAYLKEWWNQCKS